MASQTAVHSHRPPRRLLPRGYQALSPVGQVLVPVAFIYAVLLPAGLALELAGLVIPPYRLAALVLMPFALGQLARQKTSVIIPDILIVAGGIWAMLAMYITEGPGDGLEAGGSFMIDMVGSYLIGRAYITDIRKLRTVLILALPGIIGVAIIMAIEAISHRLIIAPFFPQRASLQNLYEVRLGLMRARAVFPHSIAAGIFMASFLSMYYTLGVEPRKRLLGIVAALAAIFSGSSSAYLMILIAVFFLGYKWFFNAILKRREQLAYILFAFIGLFILTELLTGRGAIRTFINILALNPASGYYRLLIWEYGTLAVQNNPLFGIGNAPMPRPQWMRMETIDNHWLTLAVRYGLPTALLTGAGVIWAIISCVRRNARLNDFDRATTLGAVIALIALSVVAWVVALWANHVAWYMLLVGAVAALAHQLPKAPTRRPRYPARGPVQPRRVVR